MVSSLRVDSRSQINDEREDVECKNKAYSPFQNCGRIVLLLEVRSSKAYGQCNGDQDEKELDPKAKAQNAVLAEICQQLVF